MSTRPIKVHSPCETCRFRRLSEERPDSLLARFWRWHTRWCPGWRSYQRELAEAEERLARVEALRPRDPDRD